MFKFWFQIRIFGIFRFFFNRKDILAKFPALFVRLCRLPPSFRRNRGFLRVFQPPPGVGQLLHHHHQQQRRKWDERRQIAAANYFIFVLAAFTRQHGDALDLPSHKEKVEENFEGLSIGDANVRRLQTTVRMHLLCSLHLQCTASIWRRSSLCSAEECPAAPPSGGRDEDSQQFLCSEGLKIPAALMIIFMTCEHVDV